MLTVVLFGNSLLLSSIGASLEGPEGLHVVPVNTEVADAARLARAINADVVVFDVAAAHPDAVTLWKAVPGLLLIGVDVLADTAIVLSGTTRRVCTARDLADVIREHQLQKTGR